MDIQPVDPTPYIVLLIGAIVTFITQRYNNNTRDIAKANDETIKEIKADLRELKDAIEDIKDDRANRNESVNEKISTLSQMMTNKLNDILIKIAKL